MNNFLLICFLICLAVVFVMVKQINKITTKIDQKEIENSQRPSIYASFSAFIQENVREIKTHIDHTKQTPYPTYRLINEEDEEKSLEFLADTIRKLVFFETMNSKRKNPKEIERELFEVLNSLDDFLTKKIQNGEKIADELRKKFAERFDKLKNQ